MHCSSILAATNEDGDVWNEAIQDLNPILPKSITRQTFLMKLTILMGLLLR
jgi:hypothetical protein